MTKDASSTLNLPKFDKTLDYIQWNCRVYSYIRREDAILTSLSKKPEYGDTGNWEESSAKSKSNSIFV